MVFRVYCHRCPRFAGPTCHILFPSARVTRARLVGRLGEVAAVAVLLAILPPVGVRRWEERGVVAEQARVVYPRGPHGREALGGEESDGRARFAHPGVQRGAPRRHYHLPQRRALRKWRPRWRVCRESVFHSSVSRTAPQLVVLAPLPVRSRVRGGSE